MFWQGFFSIYPFSEDRADSRAAMLATVIANTSGHLKRPVDPSLFMPKFLKETRKPMNTNKTLEEQRREWNAFKTKYKAAEQAARGG